MKKFVSILLFLLVIFCQLPAYTAEIEVLPNQIVPIRLNEKYNSKNVTEGMEIDAQIASDIKIQNILIFKEGDKAKLKIISVKKAKFLGIPGEITVSGGKVYDTKGIEHNFEFNQIITGEEKTYPKVCLTISLFFLWPLALCAFVKGGQAELLPLKTIDAKIVSGFTFTY